MKVIIFKEKHGDRIFISENEDIHKVFLKIFKERNNARNYELRDPGNAKFYEVACNDEHSEQARAAHLFMQYRADYEYEGFDITNPETLDED